MPCKWYRGPTHAHISSGSSGFGLRFDRVTVTIEFTILGTSAASGARGSWYNITDATTETKRCSSAIAALGLIHFFRFSFGQSSRVLLSYGLSKMMHGFVPHFHPGALVRPAAIRRAQGVMYAATKFLRGIVWQSGRALAASLRHGVSCLLTAVFNFKQRELAWSAAAAKVQGNISRPGKALRVHDLRRLRIFAELCATMFNELRCDAV